MALDEAIHNGKENLQNKKYIKLNYQITQSQPSVFAENNAVDPEYHPTIQKITPTEQFKLDVNWTDLDQSTQNTI